MIKKIFNLIKKVVISAFIIYGYNLIAAPLNLLIPINVITVGMVAFLGIPSLLGLIVILLIAF